MAQSKVIVVVPCYNEERRLAVATFRSFILKHTSFDFLFVNDGSKDLTQSVLENLCQRTPDRFSLLTLEKNSGKAEAVRQGILAALDRNPLYVAFWDADLATPLETLPSFLEIFEARPGTEVVLGSRVKLLGRDIQRQAARHYMGRVFATLASMILNLGVYDTQCGAKMFRATPSLRQIFEKPFVSRWIFDVEILKRFIRNNRGDAGLIYEYPLMVWHDIKGSKLGPLDFFRAIGDLIKIFLTHL